MPHPLTNPLAAYRNQRVLVLGASGFIGRWVARVLSQAGANLVLPLRDPGAAAPLLAQYQIRGQIIPFDLHELAGLPALLHTAQPAIVFNLAGYGVDRRERDPDAAQRINTGLVETLARQLAELPAEPSWTGQRLVHTGSALEYGTASGYLGEETPPSPTTSYGITKLAATRFLQEFCPAAALPALTARLFTVYGPGEHSGRLLPTLLENVAGQQPIPFSDGLQSRDFTYVEDVALGLALLGLAPPRWGDVVNLATGRMTTVRDFIVLAAQTLGIPDHRLHWGVLPQRPEEMAHLGVLVNRLQVWLNWSPATEISEGVSRAHAFQASLSL